MLLELADAFERNAEALIELLALENGKSEVDARHLKRFGLELGGKTPMMVFADAVLDAAIPVLVKALTVFAGQFCMTGSRLLVH